MRRLFFPNKSPEETLRLVVEGLSCATLAEREQFCIDSNITPELFECVSQRVLESVRSRPFFDAVATHQIVNVANPTTQERRRVKLNRNVAKIKKVYALDCQYHYAEDKKTFNDPQPETSNNEVDVDLSKAAPIETCVFDTGATVSVVSSRVAEELGIKIDSQKTPFVYKLSSSIVSSESALSPAARVTFCVAVDSFQNRVFELETAVVQSNRSFALFGLGDIKKRFRFELVVESKHYKIRSWLTEAGEGLTRIGRIVD